MAAGNVVTGTPTSGATFEVDNTVPVINQITTIASNNSTVDISFSELVYTSTGGSGVLGASDFALTISQNGGAAVLQSATPSYCGIYW